MLRAGGQRLQVVAVVSDVAQPGIAIPALAPDTYRLIARPVETLTSTTVVGGSTWEL